jgi:DNA-binding beta-propeller fold protein YncE
VCTSSRRDCMVMGSRNAPRTFVIEYRPRRTSVCSYFYRLASVFSLTIVLRAQAPHAGLDYLQNITIPGWSNSGSTQANFDPFAFNPVNHTMYVADRTNHGVFAIDTHSNEFVGSCNVRQPQHERSADRCRFTATDRHRRQS